MINIKYYEQRAAYDAGKSNLILPNVSYCHDTEDVLYNQKPKPQDYLTFVAEEDGTFKFSGNSINYSLDDGTTWKTLESNTDSPTVSAGGKIMWKGELTPTSNGIGKFSSSGSFTAQGNVMSLLHGDDFKGKTDLSEKDYAFRYLFRNCTGLTNAENISLPATTLANGCYQNMFQGCTSLTIAPSILPATTLANYCYQYMFADCTSLTTAPELPATTLAEGCYVDMFNNCTSLATAPSLPATTLANFCYYEMFNGCTNLNNITCLATNISATDCTIGWVYGVAATGTFIKAASMTSWTTGVDDIPTGWAVQDYQP